MAGLGGVFLLGKHKVGTKEIEAANSVLVSPPKPLLIAYPCEEGRYPTMVFLQGFLLQNHFYEKVLYHVASHGFIVVAPQLYKIAGPDCTKEIRSAAATVDWLPAGLQAKLPKGVQPDFTRLALAGHSRGGKVAFALSLGLEAKARLTFSALLAIDPVDGTAPGSQVDPPVLTYVPDSLDPKAPVLVVGTGLGTEKKDLVLPACAPEGVNHEEFFKDCMAPAFHAVAKNYGHMDMLDDNELVEGVARCLCESGNDREPMRRFVGGIMVAFSKAYLLKESDDLKQILEMPDKVSPVVLTNVEFKEN